MKITLHFPGGPSIEADVLKKEPRYAVHRSINCDRGWVITDTETLRCITWCRTQVEAKRERRAALSQTP
jgi:hypothetical protein